MAKSTSVFARHSFLNGAAAIALAVAMLVPHGQALAQAPQAAADEQGLEEIVVTAQRRSENLQVVPISVTAITASTLAKTGLSNTLLLTQAVPSVQLTKSGNASIFYIRGVGNASGSTGEEGANAFYIDGVYLSDIVQANAEFNNIERVEILKGPQGTLFGRNSSGGLVNIITKTPGQNFELKGSVGYGNYDTIRGQLYVAGPLSEKISADLALTGRNQRNGWGKNVFTGDDTAEGYYYGVRSKLVFRPSDSAKLVLSGDYWDSFDTFYTGFTLIPGSVGSAGNTFVGFHNRNSANPQSAHLRVGGISLTGEFDLGFADLTSITSYRKQKSTAYVDSDYSPAQIAELFIPSGVKAFQQELRLASNAGGPLNWQVGGFLYRAHAFVNQQESRGAGFGGVGRGNNLDADMKTRSIAGFGEVTYDVTPSTHLTAGGRYTHETRGIHQVRTPFNQTTPPNASSTFLDTDLIPGFPKKISFNKFTYRVAIRQDITERINVYASYNRGFKSGIYALQAPGGTPVKPQVIDAFEAGFKSELLDRTLRFNAAYFHYKVKDYQVRAAPSAIATPILLNATSVKVDGLEAELTFQPNRELNITANGTYLKSRFGTFNNAPFTFPNTTAVPATVPAATACVSPLLGTGTRTGGNRTCLLSASGNRTPLSPKFAGSVSATYTIPLSDVSEVRVNGIVSYNDGYYFELDNRLRQPSYTVINGSIEYRYNEHWGVEFFMTNITDKEYYVTQLGSGTGDHGELAAPRMYGVNLKFDF
jgi:iron complex outermembrane recepter protein